MCEPVLLWPQGCPGEFQPLLKRFPHPEGGVRPAVIVCPGGAYCGRAAHEGDPVAQRFNELGFHSFTLEYRVAPAQYPAPQLDALRAVKLVRANAVEWQIDPERIVMLGFSAGGHLAFSTTYFHEELSEQCRAGDEADAVSGRPDAVVLCYAVVSAVSYQHYGSFRNLLGRNEIDIATLKKFSGELRADKNTPPVFMWHSAEDAGVPVENSLLLAAALRRNGVPFGLAVYPFGPHGTGLAEKFPDAACWPQTAANFLNTIWSV